METWKQEKLVEITLDIVLLNDTIFFWRTMGKSIIMMVSRDMYYIYEIPERCFEIFIKLN